MVRIPRMQRLEFADEADFRLQVLVELLPNFGTRSVDQLSNVGGGGVTEIDHDVGVHVGDLCVTDAKPLQAALIDQSSGADPFDLLEDRSSARVPVEPGVLTSAPAEILLHDAVEDIGITLRESKGGREHDVCPVVKNGIVVCKLHIIGADRATIAFGGQDVARVEDFGDEHRPVSFRGWREKMEILPDGSANRARNAHIMLEAGPPARHSFLDQILDRSAAFRPELASAACFTKFVVPCGVADDDA